MEAALEHFQLDVTGLTCLDAGLSTGGFTDCLLQRGAAKVYGVDVGFGQVQLLSQVTVRCIPMQWFHVLFTRFQFAVASRHIPALADVAQSP